jgi:hypothetical protein
MEQFAHRGDECDFGWLAAGDEPVQGHQSRVASHGSATVGIHSASLIRRSPIGVSDELLR